MSLKLYVLFLQLTIFYNGCNIAIAMTGRNVRYAREFEFPMIVSIALIIPSEFNQDISNGHLCTGTLISRSDILTASHCLQFLYLEQIRIIYGNVDLRAGITYDPFWWIHYNEWAEMYEIPITYNVNDIAFIKLYIPVPETVITALITNRTHEQLYTRRVKIAGWSLEDNGNVDFKQKTANLFVVAKAECDEAISELTGVVMEADIRILCTRSNPPVVLDTGDNGAPLLSSRNIVAVSVGTCPASAQTPVRISVHFSLYFYRQFIWFLLNNF